MRALYIRFSRRILRAFVMPSFLVRVFAKPPSGSFPEGGCVGVLILMRLGLAGGLGYLCKNRSGGREKRGRTAVKVTVPPERRAVSRPWCRATMARAVDRPMP